jgi:hypothetical protein
VVWWHSSQQQLTGQDRVLTGAGLRKAGKQDTGRWMAAATVVARVMTERGGSDLTMMKGVVHTTGSLWFRCSRGCQICDPWCD